MAGTPGGRIERTNTWNVAVAVAPPLSATWRTMSFSPLVASHAAVMTALIVPLSFEIEPIVIPDGTLVAVTVSEPALSSASLTVATMVLVAGSPWLRLIGEDAVITGVVFAAAVNAKKKERTPTSNDERVT